MVDLKLNRRRRPKGNLADLAYEEIKDAIVHGKMRPGDYLGEGALAQALEMSRTPVREALKRLASENLVEITPKGAFVKEVSPQDIEEIYELREVLECLAVQTAVRNITQEEMDQLESRGRSLKEELKAGGPVDWRAVSKWDNDLHALIISKCTNSYLKQFMGILNRHILRYQLLAAQALSDPENTIRQHLEMIALIRQGDPERLTTVLRAHIREARALLLGVHASGRGLAQAASDGGQSEEKRG